MAGYVPRNATVMRTLIMACSCLLALFFTRLFPDNSELAVIYFVISEILYLGFIMAVLPENGLRKFFFRHYKNENEAYGAYETILGFLFFHNAISISYISSANEGNLLRIIDRNLMFFIVSAVVVTGFAIKISAAKIASIEIYYWKDMFLGRKISEFKVTGPYNYLKNPMYGIGQVQAYAIAVWYGSEYGLLAAALNQILIFAFYFSIEKNFIRRTYHNK